MSFMFRNTAFNQDISGWNVSSVTTMTGMFRNTAFNQDISSWNVSNVTDMTNMFTDASSFNQDISGWDVSSVTSMSSMLLRATSFNQDISSWNVSNVTNMTNMLNGSAFNQTNYDLLLVAWDQLTLQNNVSFHAGTAQYSAGSPATARANIISTYTWTITDGGQAP